MMELLAQATTLPNDAPLIWGFVLVGAALILLFMELFVPSGGILSLCSGVAVIGSIVAFFVHSPGSGLIAVICYVILGPLLLWFGFRWWAGSSLGHRMILGAEEDPIDRSQEEAYAHSSKSQRERAHYLDKFVGQRGEAETRLCPVGSIRIDGQRHEALAETGVIEAGAPVVITEVYDNQLKVRQVDPG